MDDRQTGSDRKPPGRARRLRRRAVRRLSGQPEDHGQPMRTDASRLRWFESVLIMVALLFAGATHASRVSASDPGSGDWPMWGGTPDRNMVSTMKGLPTEWDVKTKKNVKWIAELGSKSYGNPVVDGGMVFVGTNNERLRDPKQPGDRGVLMAFRESDGEFLWQQTHEKLAAGRANDWPYQGVASSPLVEGTHLYYTSNRGVVWCLDINGFRDGKNDGAATGKKLWEFDTNPKDSVWPKTRNELIATPVIYQDRVYIGNGQDPEHGEGVGHFYCIDATKRGDITQSGRVWQFDKIRRSISTASIVDGFLYVPDFSGFLHCLDAKTGQEYWTHDMFAAVWGSTLVVDGKVYLGDEDGDVTILQAGKEKKVLGEMNMGSAVYATPVPAHGALFLNNRNQLFALAANAGTK